MTTETDNTDPPDYGSVPNISLREFLQEYEKIIQVNPYPINAIGYRFEKYSSCGIQLKSQAGRIACMLRDRGIIEANLQGEKKKGVTYYILKFGIWGRRAIAAFHWTYLELPFCKNSMETDISERLGTLREALGNHPLASYIHDPKGENNKDNPGQISRLDPDTIVFEDGSKASLRELHIAVENRRSDEIVEPNKLGLTNAQLEKIIKLATGITTIVDDEIGVNTERFKACLKTLQINPQKS